MQSATRYSIILERTGQVLLAQASLSQLEAFWDAHDAQYYGLRIEDEQSPHARVIVTDELPDDDDADLA
ncbi:hypothetical protein N8H22_03645 [Stutzerimonas stutzeri]|uniref:hypothetical protein n=1 Tax=Stutzerimonas sp. S1 TaxID=3030652 RepID=UPI002224246E|nr:hypothetical protein [Stutzerimonas sp. S1]MCW3147699.1 hypothetical protein [Stutzerimonas sp. S1]